MPRQPLGRNPQPRPVGQTRHALHRCLCSGPRLLAHSLCRPHWPSPCTHRSDYSPARSILSQGRAAPARRTGPPVERRARDHCGTHEGGGLCLRLSGEMARRPEHGQRWKVGRCGFPDRPRFRPQRRGNLLWRTTQLLFTLPERRAGRRTQRGISARPTSRRDDQFHRHKQGQTLDGSLVVLHRPLADAGSGIPAQEIRRPYGARAQRHPLRGHDRGHGPGHRATPFDPREKKFGQGHPCDFHERQRGLRRGFRLPTPP